MVYKKLQYYPLAVRLKDKTALVIGGGKIAWRKVEALLYAGSNVRIVSPTATFAIKTLAKSKKVEWIARSVKESDLKNVDIVIAATNKRSVNELVSKVAKKYKVWVNVVDQPLLSDFISPALFSEDKAIVAVYTDGEDPVLSRDLKNFLKDRWYEFLYYRNKLQSGVSQKPRNSLQTTK